MKHPALLRLVATLAPVLALVAGLQPAAATDAKKNALSPDWRAMTLSEFKRTDQYAIRAENKGMLSATGDFDGDGRVDHAALARHKDGHQYGLVIVLDRAEGATVIPYYTTQSFEEIASQGIGLANPDTYETACGKGYWTCAAGEPAKVTLTAPGIAFFTIESASSILIWDKAKAAFTMVPLDE